MDSASVIEALRRFNVPHGEIAKVIGRDRTAATKMMNGDRNIQARELPGLEALVAEYERRAGEVDQNSGANSVIHYVPVEVLPTFAGMGGGGTGDAESRVAMLPRRLVEDELRARPADLLMIDVRGNSMEPLFYHGDQILIDRRDKNPVQPGPFALWDGDGYVVKNVERRAGRYRIFSSNKDYAEWETQPDQIEIMGRPVWYARRL
jgi:phage repressor protein C with HTH and peptisase S24 domain